MRDKPQQDVTTGAPRRPFFSQFNNWISAAGAVIAIGSLFAFLLLLALDTTAAEGSPYLGILTFLVAPFFLVLGLFLILAGWLVDRWYLKRTGAVSSFLRFSLDFGNPVERRKFILFGAGTSFFLFLTALGSYRTYHFTESTQFCGEVCHTVMEPEYTTYLQSPHARVACVDCHIGEGATWYVKSKIDGLYQVYATMVNSFPRPIPTPIESLRPAQDTCEQCHWPQVFTGSLDRVHERTLSDADNTPFAVRLVLKVGGGDPRLGRVSGIHWHTDPNNRVEYIAVDEQRMDIPWVRLSRAGEEQGTIYMREGFDDTEALASHEVRVMDCIDCHNRPAHILFGPNDAVDRAFTLNRLDRAYPDLKYNVVDLLVGDYADRDQAHAAIRDGLTDAYADQAGLQDTINEVIRIYDTNFFPLMKANWETYPNHLGHKNWPGCFRCHGGEHYAVETGAALAPTDCNSCHTILAQGSGEQLLQLNAAGHAFAHPDGDVEGLLCSDCHTGGPM
jgi:nitrate/TMAO reductase-like tetraheme cytochrome c subunit